MALKLFLKFILTLGIMIILISLIGECNGCSPDKSSKTKKKTIPASTQAGPHADRKSVV